MTTPASIDMTQVAAPFPAPPDGLRRMFDVLNQPQPAQTAKPGQASTAAISDDLARPWNPARCPPAQRLAIWTWCEEVAEWINHEYCWRPDTMIPACWPAHSHIARELAVLAALRWTAEQARDPHPIEVWERETYPGFRDRMTQRLGESTCRAGRHIDWPAAARHAAYHGSCRDRLATISHDSPTTTTVSAARLRP